MTGICIAIGALLGLGWLWWEFKNAPAGFQDDDGFHFDEPDDEQ